jgi:hypothetical protein
MNTSPEIFDVNEASHVHPLHSGLPLFRKERGKGVASIILDVIYSFTPKEWATYLPMEGVWQSRWVPLV